MVNKNTPTGTQPQDIPPLPPGVFKTLGYGDPIMIELMGLDTSMTKANFDHVDLYSPKGGWGAVHKFQILDRQAMDYLKSIQPNDFASSGFKTKQKMNWLVGQSDKSTPDRPYWTKGDAWDGKWKTFSFGIMVFGHQLVKVETDANGNPKEYEFTTDFPNSTKKRPVTFYKPVGMKRSEIGKFTHQTHPWFIQKATAANQGPKPNTIDYYPKGVLYHPVWDLNDWPTNFGSDLYLAKDFLVAPEVSTQ